MDCGAYQMKISTAQDKAPMLIYNATGQLKSKRRSVAGNKIIDEFDKGNSVFVEHTMARGLFHNTDAMTGLWREAFSKIKKFDAT